MKKLALLTIPFVFAPVAEAALVSVDGDIVDETGISYTYFSIDATSAVRLETFTDGFDPMLYLYNNDGDLSSDDYITYNDDSGVDSAYGYSNSLINTTLAAGDYIAIVGDYSFDDVDILLGYNSDSSNAAINYGSFTLEIETDVANISAVSTETGVSPVPVPAAAWLFGSGLLGLMGVAKRRRA